ncbi:unnamed protein product [Ambrosiozyma monospora]|uniref:Unnamed protein product n=1 Tax=Ambrosiozyma monospora TaxID=43982 RepID=A0ACB5U8D8_AMBMO|nr:unnamed protein product [Ambrosiozyma monospora]
MKITTSSPTARVVVLFKNDCFQTSKMMEDAINTISKKHLTQSTRFVRINAVDAPFLTTRLDIRVLPCVVSYIGGKETGRIVGLEGLINGTDLKSFKVENLERLFLGQGLLDRKAFDLNVDFSKTSENKSIRTGLRGSSRTSYDDEDSDLDI